MVKVSSDCPTGSDLDLLSLIFGPSAPFPRLQDDDPNQPSLPAPALYQKQLDQPDQQEQDVDPATWRLVRLVLVALEPAKSEGSCGKASN